MKIAISSCGTDLKDKVHDLFGRCVYFIIFDLETGEVKPVKNAFSETATGAGTACAQFIFDEGVEAVISGKIGPNAYEVLTLGGIKIFISPPGITAEQALDKYKKGLLQKMEVIKYT